MSQFPSPLVLIALIALPAAVAYAGCDKCQRPQVLQFDTKILPSRPSDASDSQLVKKILEWRNLFWVSAGIKDHVFGSDPTRDCFTHLDGSFFTKGDTVSSSITFGEEWNNLPPSLGPAGGDYLVTGVVDGAGGSYTLQVELQVSKTREVVASSRKTFTSADEPMNVGKGAASAMGPIVEKIRAFEKTKRATGDPYALWPTAELHPAKTNIKEGESVEVELWLYDCDGDIATSPLANRPVRVEADNGTVSDRVVTTGADGKAVFTFTGGSKKGEAILTATYPYKLASEHNSVGNIGQAAILISEVPSTLWKVNGMLSTLRTYDETQRSDHSKISEGSVTSRRSSDLYAVNGIISNVARSAAVLFKGDTLAPQVNISGSSREDETWRGFFRMPESWGKEQSYKTVFSQPVPSTEGRRHIAFDYFRLPDDSTRFGGGFALFNIMIEGSSRTTGRNCSSEEGCKDISEEGEAFDEIGVDIPVPWNPDGESRDTSYTTSDGEVVVEHEVSKVSHEDGIFVVEYLNTSRKVKNGEGTVAVSSYTSTIDRQYTFTIAPVNHDGKRTRVAPGRIGSASSLLDARVFLGRGGLVVDFVAGSNGVLGARLFDLNGRVLSQGVRWVEVGGNAVRFPVPSIGGGVLVAELVFTPASGDRPKRILRMVSPGGKRASVRSPEANGAFGEIRP